MEIQVNRERTTLIAIEPEQKEILFQRFDSKEIEESTIKCYFDTELKKSNQHIRSYITKTIIPNVNKNFKTYVINLYLTIDLTHYSPAQPSDQWAILVEYTGR